MTRRALHRRYGHAGKIGWQGTDYIERRLNLVNNRLSFVIVPSSAGRLPRATEEQYLADAKDAYAWLASQKTPASVRGWARYQLDHLKTGIVKAEKALGR